MSVQKLNTLHWVCTIAHFIQFAYSIGLGFSGTFFEVNITRKELLELPPPATGNISLFNVLSTYQIARIVWLFPFLAFLDHAYCLYFFKTKYTSILDKKYNKIRWIEYSASAGIMFWVIAQLSGVEEITLLITLLLSNIAMQLCGLLNEMLLSYNNKQQEAMLALFIGWLPFLAIWVPIMTSFYTTIDDLSSSPPDFVYSIVIILFILTLSFGVLATLQTWGKYEWVTSFINIEMAYCILSLAAKTLLTNLTLFGSMRSED